MANPAAKTMQQTFPPRICDHWPAMRAQPQKCAFTLIEVLTALAVVAVATFVVTSALISVARAEGLSQQLQHGPLVIRTIVARERMHPLQHEDRLEIGGWRVSAETLTAAPEGGLPFRWRKWTLSPAERPSLQVSFCAPVTDQK